VFSGVFDYQGQSGEEDAKMLNVPGAYMVGSVLLSLFAEFNVDKLTNQEKDFEPYVLPKSWATALDNMSPLASGGVYFIKGPSKSTFARTLLNRFLVQ
jgi:hypothetical protein